MDFLTLTDEAFGETEEKKSRFLAYVVPFTNFESRLDELRNEHPKANHHVTAFRMIHDTNQVEEGAKDDGEPSGTSGMPILKLLIGRNLIDVGAIVVRYFGGTKLGTCGLARAYPGAVKEALEVGRDVFMVGASGSTEKRLQKLKLLERLPEQNITPDRLVALQRAVALAPADA